ncbi:zinc-binding dehydrogenase [Streptomyces sp. NPDC059679]|uniref:zinc-binding dehydrogenase n=1 Tax=Streptomyces sp. NPDC059679 TaxID=3346903 RepID=UPI003675F78E
MQTAAGSSVGRLVTGVSRFHHFGLVNVVRSDRGAAELRRRFPDVPVVSTEHPGWTDAVREAAAGRPVSVALDPIGGKPAESLLDLLTPGGKLASYGLIAEEPIPLHASALLNKSLTLQGKNIGRWLSEASAERRASDVATAQQVALGLKDQFAVAAEYGLGELTDAVEHAVRPGKVGTRPRPPLTATVRGSGGAAGRAGPSSWPVPPGSRLPAVNSIGSDLVGVRQIPLVWCDQFVDGRFGAP